MCFDDLRQVIQQKQSLQLRYCTCSDVARTTPLRDVDDIASHATFGAACSVHINFARCLHAVDDGGRPLEPIKMVGGLGKQHSVWASAALCPSRNFCAVGLPHADKVTKGSSLDDSPI